FFLAAPVVVAGVVSWWVTRWGFQPAFFDVELTRIIGIVVTIVGALGLLDSFTRFALQGLGTPAPVGPARFLFVTCLFRFVRNPMYVAVVAVVFGQAALFSYSRLLRYGALCWLAFHIFVLAYEEPALRRTYGAEYEAYQANVPRWIPRLTPWQRV